MAWELRLLILSSIMFLCNVHTSSAEDKTRFGFTADYFSKYVWRGQDVNNRSVFQSSVYVSRNGFTGSVWGNQDLTSKNNGAGEFVEFDYALYYCFAIPGVNLVSFSVGGIYYEFPNTRFKPTTEVYGGINLNLPYTPYIKLYRDVGQINGSYLQLGVGHTIEKIVTFSDKLYCGLQLDTNFGWASADYNRVVFQHKQQSI